MSEKNGVFKSIMREYYEGVNIYHPIYLTYIVSYAN
jgi:hypothetical protein